MKPIYTLASLAILVSGSVIADSLPVADSGLVSVFPNQVAQLNVVNVGDSSQGCSFSLSFVDSSGVPTPPNLITIKGGESDSIQFENATASPILLRAHLDFSAQLLSGTDTKDPLNGCYRLNPSFEVMDSNGTQVLNTQFYGMPSSKKGEKMEKVKICHKPNPHAEKTLEVPVTALKGHLGHSDSLGECHK